MSSVKLDGPGISLKFELAGYLMLVPEGGRGGRLKFGPGGSYLYNTSGINITIYPRVFKP